MDTARLWVALLCVCGSLIVSLAIDCDWTTQYEHEKRCCKACPSGEYPKQLCSENSDSECVKCPANTKELPDREKCFCKEKHLCIDENCQTCNPRPICKPGEHLKRTGNFQFNYYCETFQSGTYNDAEDSSSKPFTKRNGVESFPGNQTHSAIDSPVVHSTAPKTEPHDKDKTPSFMVACLMVTVLTCLVFVMYAAFQMFKVKILIKLNKQCKYSSQYSSDSCACKLSKEEMGEEKHLEILDDKCDPQLSVMVQ